MKIIIQYLKLCFISILLLINISCQKEVFTEPASELAAYDWSALYVNSIPAGAMIYVNGKNTGSITPDTVKWIEEGEISVKLKKENFLDTTFTSIVEKNVVKSVLIDYYGDTRMYGSIVCQSRPEGAVVYLNNQNTGKVTPCTLDRLIPDYYTVKFDYPDYRKDSISFTVKSKGVYPIFKALEDTLDIITYRPGNSDLMSDNINDISEDKEGNIWIATGAFGPVKFDGKKFTRYRYGSDPAITSDYVNQIKRDKEDNLWVGFSNGLAKYNGRAWEKVDTKGKGITSIFVSDDNTVLAGTDEAGILRYKNGQYDFLTKENSGLPFNQVHSTCVDRQGKIWAALGDYGIGVYDGSSWIRLDSANNGLPERQCSSIALTPEGEVVGTFYRIIMDWKGRIVEYCPHAFAKFDGSKWIILYSYYDYTAARQTFTDKKNGFWFRHNGIKRRVNGAIMNIEDIVQKDLRIFASYANPAASILYSKGVFIDSKENLWLYGNVSYGLVKIKKGRWNY